MILIQKFCGADSNKQIPPNKNPIKSYGMWNSIGTLEKNKHEVHVASHHRHLPAASSSPQTSAPPHLHPLPRRLALNCTIVRCKAICVYVEEIK